MSVSNQSARIRLGLVLACIGLVMVLLVLASNIVFPFVASGVLAYILYPIVSSLESWMPWRQRLPNFSRIASILTVFLVAVAVLIGATVIILPSVLAQGSQFLNEAPNYYGMVRTTLEGWGNAYASKIPEDVKVSMEGYASQSGSVLIEAIRHVLIRTLGLLTNVVSTVIGLAVVPFMLFYLLKDRESAVEGVYSLIPPEARRHANKTLDIVNRVLGAYIRAQLTLGLIVGSMVSLGLFLLGIKFSVLLGIIAGATELIPIIGPMLGAIPGVFVTLATSPEKIVWVLSLYIGLQVLENIFLVPRIQSHAVGLHPAVIMIVLMVGSEAAGLWGVLLSVPLAAVGRDVFKYFHNEWGGTAALSQQEQRPNNETVSSDETMEIS